MKITSVTCHLCRAVNPDGYEAGSAIIRVETDEGVSGHGEALMGLFSGEVAAAIVHYYEPLLIGKDPADRAGLWQLMYESSVWWGRSGAAPGVMGAIEVALWDIAGIVAGKPCYQLLSDTPRSTVPVYASLGSAPKTPAHAAPLLAELDDAGFRGLKMGLTFGDLSGFNIVSPKGEALYQQLDETLSAIRAVTGNDYMIGVDAHAGGVVDPISREEALGVARILEKHHVAFVEEQLDYLELHGYAWLRSQT